MQAHLSIGLLCLPWAVCSPDPKKTPVWCSGEQEQWDVVRPKLLFLVWFLRCFLLARSPPQGGGWSESSTLSLPWWLGRAGGWAGTWMVRLMDVSISLALESSPGPSVRGEPGVDTGPGSSASASQSPRCWGSAWLGSQTPRGWLRGRAQTATGASQQPALSRASCCLLRYFQALCCGCKNSQFGRSYRLLSGAFPRCSGENASGEGKGLIVLLTCPCLEQCSL